MKEYVALFFRLCYFIIGLILVVTTFVALFKGDPMHVTFAYFAASILFLDRAGRD